LAVCLHLRRPLPPEVVRLRAAMEMRETGVAMYRQRMRREHPGASEKEIDVLVRAWLLRPRHGEFPHQAPRKDDDDTR